MASTLVKLPDLIRPNTRTARARRMNTTQTTQDTGGLGLVGVAGALQDTGRPRRSADSGLMGISQVPSDGSGFQRGATRVVGVLHVHRYTGHWGCYPGY